MKLAERDRSALLDYIRGLQHDLGLDQWTIELCDEDAADDALASVRALPERSWAEISIAADFRTYSRDEQRRALVHELIHVHQQGVWHAVKSLERVLGTIGFPLFDDRMRIEIERTAHGIACAVAAFYPLIEWPGDGAA